MKPAEAKLALAKEESERARKRLIATVDSVHYRLPQTIASSAQQGLREKGQEVLDAALQAVKERPVTVSSVIAGVSLLVARKTVVATMDAFRRRSAKPRKKASKE